MYIIWSGDSGPISAEQSGKEQKKTEKDFKKTFLCYVGHL